MCNFSFFPEINKFIAKNEEQNKAEAEAAEAKVEEVEANVEEVTIESTEVKAE